MATLGKYKTPNANPRQPDKYGNVNDFDHQGRPHYNAQAMRNNPYADDLPLPDGCDPDIRRMQMFEGYKLACRDPHLYWSIWLPSDRDPATSLPIELQGVFTSLDTVKRAILLSKGKME